MSLELRGADGGTVKVSPEILCAMKPAACCCTRRYSVVCSGRWRS